jgi:galactose oxidase
MFDVDMIFTVGGVQNYDLADEPSSSRAYIIDISNPDDPSGPAVERLPDMAWGRASLNVVALPNGMVVVVGGQTNTRPFSDDFAVLSVEMYDPSSKSWFEFSQPLTTARNYHSAALLMKDGRIVVGGGGLCHICDINTSWVRATECHCRSNTLLDLFVLTCDIFFDSFRWCAT